VAPFEFAYPLTLFNGGLRRDATQGVMEIREKETQRERKKMSFVMRAETQTENKTFQIFGTFTI
jgi:hypothetical protein